MSINISLAKNKNLLLTSIAFFFIFMGAGAFQQFVVSYLGSLGWSTLKAASILAVVYSSFMFCRFLAPYTLWYFKDYLAALIGGITYGLFVLAVFLLPSYPALIIFALVWGWGASIFWTAGSTLILDEGDRTKSYGSYMSVFYSSTHLGFLIGVLALGAILSRYGYRPLFTFSLASTLLGILILVPVSRKRSEREKPKINKIIEVLSVPKAGIIGFFLLGSNIGFGLLLSVYGQFVTQVRGADYLHTVTSFFYLARMFASLLSGSISDRVGRHRVFLVSYLLSTLGLATAALWPTITGLTVSAMALGILAGAVPTLATASIGDSSSKGRRHIAVGAIFVWRDLGIVAAIMLGQIIGINLGLRATFAIFAGIFALSALLSIDLGRRIEERF